MRENAAKEAVRKVPKEVFFGQIQRGFMTSFVFSKCRCGGQNDLTDEENEYIENMIRNFFPDYDVKENGLMPLIYALTEREVSRY